MNKFFVKEPGFFRRSGLALEPPTEGLDPEISISVKTIDQDGVISHCGFPTVTINWGDGSTPFVDTNDPTINHTYHLDPDETETFTITAEMNVENSDDCLGCDVDKYQTSTTYTVTNDFCKKVMTDVEVLAPVTFSAGGGDWKYYGRGGQNPTYKLFNDRKVWGEIYTYKKIGGDFKRKRPDHSAYVRVFKSTFNHDDCSEGEATFDVYEQKRDSRLRVIHRPGRNFSTQNELSDEPLLDFKEFITSSGTPNSSRFNLELHPD